MNKQTPDEIYSRLKSNYSLVPEDMPTVATSEEFLAETLDVLFPQCRTRAAAGANRISELQSRLATLLEGFAETAIAKNVSSKFINKLPELQELMITDAHAIWRGDPAATSVTEVIVAYPGFYATCVHRIAHSFYLYDIPLFPRILSEISHQKTGVDIHPGAQIAESFCIDHGTGIVVGETSVIEKNVKLYQGVTLGGLSISKDLANKKRHPTIEENVVIYSNATILGGNTVIGKDSIIGGNVWITSSIEPGSKVYHQQEFSVRAI